MTLEELKQKAISASQGVTQHMVELDGPTILKLLAYMESVQDECLKAGNLILYTRGDPGSGSSYFINLESEYEQARAKRLKMKEEMMG